MLYSSDFLFDEKLQVFRNKYPILGFHMIRGDIDNPKTWRLKGGRFGAAKEGGIENYKGKPSVCNQGLHCSEIDVDCLRYFSFSGPNKAIIREVEIPKNSQISFSVDDGKIKKRIKYCSNVRKIHKIHDAYTYFCYYLNKQGITTFDIGYLPHNSKFRFSSGEVSPFVTRLINKKFDSSDIIYALDTGLFDYIKAFNN